MATLSNFGWPNDRSTAEQGQTVCRQARRHEIEPALRLILASGAGPADDETVLDFLALAVQRKIDVNQAWIAQVGRRIVWALLPIASPGRTMLLLSPPRLPARMSLAAVRELTEQVCAHWQSRSVDLAQFLIDPADPSLGELYLSCGFVTLAELIYLHKTVTRVPPLALPAGFELCHYSPETHAAFADTILRSYQQSLDCPSLNGRRSIDDVIAGHKATGEFEPRLWHLLTEAGRPMGVLILSPSLHATTVELVYLGLVAEARGRGLADALMRLAMGCVADQQRSELSLAVDSRNAPALRLYYRHGLKRVSSRLALLRDLRSDQPALTPA